MKCTDIKIKGGVLESFKYEIKISETSMALGRAMARGSILYVNMSRNDILLEDNKPVNKRVIGFIDFNKCKFMDNKVVVHVDFSLTPMTVKTNFFGYNMDNIERKLVNYEIKFLGVKDKSGLTTWVSSWLEKENPFKW